jgi:hypothetical protein
MIVAPSNIKQIKQQELWISSNLFSLIDFWWKGVGGEGGGGGALGLSRCISIVSHMTRYEKSGLI